MKLKKNRFVTKFVVSKRSLCLGIGGNTATIIAEVETEEEAVGILCRELMKKGYSLKQIEEIVKCKQQSTFYEVEEIRTRKIV